MCILTVCVSTTGQSNVFKELPHSLEAVDISSVEPAVKNVSKVCNGEPRTLFTSLFFAMGFHSKKPLLESH